MGAEFNKISQSAFIKATVKEISAEMIQKVCVRERERDGWNVEYLLNEQWNGITAVLKSLESTMQT